MAQPSNTFDTYDQVGIREDLTDIIHDVSPTDTPFYSSVAKTTATNTYHEWQTDALRASASNAHIEGDDTTASSRTATVRLGNYTQIFKDAIVIPRTARSVNTAGRGDELDYQMIKVGRALRLDVEKALLAINARVAGNSTTARELAGVPTWLTSNVSLSTAGSPAVATGDGTDVPTNGTQQAFTQARMDTVLQSMWENSNGSNMITVMLNAFQMTKALGFTGNNNQRATIPANRNAVANTIEVYMTPWGEVDFVMSREIPARNVYALDLTMWKVPVLDGFQTEDLAKTGDSERKQMVTELTLECCNEAASGAVFDCTVT